MSTVHNVVSFAALKPVICPLPFSGKDSSVSLVGGVKCWREVRCWCGDCVGDEWAPLELVVSQTLSRGGGRHAWVLQRQ